MATLITPSVIARSALATLYNTTVLAQLVNRDYDGDFTGKQGDTITVRTPASFTANVFNRVTGIVLQDPAEGSFTVALDTLLDVSFAVTQEELTLELVSFEEQLLNPALEAIVQDVDGRLAEGIVDAAAGGGGGGTATAGGATDQHSAFRIARRILSRNKHPFSQRYSVLSPEGTEKATSDEKVLTADRSGSTEALREGSVGRLSGFDIYESQVFGGAPVADPVQRDTAQGVAFHRSAFALVTRTLSAPLGLASAQYAVQGYKGLGIRVVRDYDIDKKQDVISLDFLMGVKPVRPSAAVILAFV